MQGDVFRRKGSGGRRKSFYTHDRSPGGRLGGKSLKRGEGRVVKVTLSKVT